MSCQREPARGAVPLGLLFTIVLVVTATGGAIYWWSSGSATTEEEDILVQQVTRGDFVLEVTETGELESSSNKEVRCEVKARNKTSGVTILRIVPEGVSVKEGDFLVEFDASSLELEKTQQQISVNTSEAIQVEALNKYETAIIAKREYLEGTFRQEQQTIQSEVFVAEEDLRRAKEYVVYSERLAAKGYITPLQLEADAFGVDKAKNELDTARTKLRVLEAFTREKQIKQLDSDIASSKAKWEAEKKSLELEIDKLTEIEDQIAKCIVQAPTDGQVKYAHKSDSRGSNDVVIEEGAVIRERQMIIRLPNVSEMQVKLTIDESVINRVRPGMEATLRLVGLKDVVLPGTVTKVNRYSEPTSRWRSSAKEYLAYVAVDADDPRLRTGMTASVTVHCEHVPDVLRVPVQAIYAHGDDFYCMVKVQDHWRARPVRIGSSNEQFVVVEEGIAENDVVSLNPRKYLEEVDLPTISADQRQQVVRRGRKASRDGVAQRTIEEPTTQQSAAPSRSRPNAGAIAKAMMQRMDKNQDGVIDGEEWPAAAPMPLAKTDTNGDGKVNSSELLAAMKKRMSGGGGRRGGPPAGGVGG